MHASQPSDLPRLPLPPQAEPHMPSGCSGQTNPVPPLPAAHPNRPATKRQYWRARYYARKTAYALDGRNSKGQPRQRRPNLNPTERPGHYRRARLANWHQHAQRRIAANLTTRGTPRRYSLVGHPAGETELAWRQLRAEMTIPTTDFLSPSERCDL